MAAPVTQVLYLDGGWWMHRAAINGVTFEHVNRDRAALRVEGVVTADTYGGQLVNRDGVVVVRQERRF